MTLTPERRSVILGLLQSGPKLSAQVQAVLKLESSSVRKLLSLMKPEVKRIGGPTKFAQWALASYVPPATPEQTPQPPRPVKSPKPALRQDVPTSTTVAKDTPRNFWETAAADGFTALCAKEAIDRMQNSIGNRWVRHQLLQ